MLVLYQAQRTLRSVSTMSSRPCVCARLSFRRSRWRWSGGGGGQGAKKPVSQPVVVLCCCLASHSRADRLRVWSAPLDACKARPAAVSGHSPPSCPCLSSSLSVLLPASSFSPSRPTPRQGQAERGRCVVHSHIGLRADAPLRCGSLTPRRCCTPGVQNTVHITLKGEKQSSVQQKRKKKGLARQPARHMRAAPSRVRRGGGALACGAAAAAAA